MSILGRFSCDLYGMMLSNYGLRSYFEQPVYIRESNGSYMPASWLSDCSNFCESFARFVADMQGIALGNQRELGKETEFFVMAAHVMFVPFGQAGYDYLKSVVAERFKGKEIGEFLYKQFVLRANCPLNGNLLKDLNKEQKEYIKDFFLCFDKKDEIQCSDPKGIATFACRLYFALYGIIKPSFQIRSLDEKYMEPIQKEIDPFLYGLKQDEVLKLKISDYIDRIPKHAPLNEYEKEFILDKFDLLKRRKK